MPRDLWEQLGQRFDPEKPADPRLHAPREASPADQIGQALDLPAHFGDPRVLLVGTTGTGKSTELLHVAAQRAQRDGEFVVFLDLVRHFSEVVGDLAALERVQSWEICAVVGAALLHAAEDRLGRGFDKDLKQAFQDAWGAMAEATDSPLPGPQLDVAALAKSMILLVSEVVPGGGAASAGLKLLGGAAGAARWHLGLGKRSVSDQESAARNLLGSVNDLLRDFRNWYQHGRILFVLDGLDRIKDLGRAREMFVESEMIGRLECPLVVAAPFALRHHMSGSVLRAFSERVVLVNAPVLRQADPAQHGRGIRFLCDLYDRRIRDLGVPDPLDRADLERLAYYSGGRARDFVRMIRDLAKRAWTLDLPRASETLVDEVIDKARRDTESGLFKQHLDILKAVMLDPEHLPADEGRTHELLTYGRLLPYSNGAEWFYPHPLLLLRMLKAPAGSTS